MSKRHTRSKIGYVQEATKLYYLSYIAKRLGISQDICEIQLRTGMTGFTIEPINDIDEAKFLIGPLTNNGIRTPANKIIHYLFKIIRGGYGEAMREELEEKKIILENRLKRVFIATCDDTKKLIIPKQLTPFINICTTISELYGEICSTGDYDTGVNL